MDPIRLELHRSLSMSQAARPLGCMRPGTGQFQLPTKSSRSFSATLFRARTGKAGYRGRFRGAFGRRMGLVRAGSPSMTLGSEPDVEEVRNVGWKRGFSAFYELSEEVLGEGSFGTVWKGYDKSNGREVAIKVLPKHRKGDWEKYSKLLKNEVKCWEALQNCPEVVKLIDYFEDDDHLYLIQEECLGGDLQHYLNEHGKLSECEASRVIAAVLRMISTCHKQGICYGDVKPSNFMFRAKYPCNRHLADASAPKGNIVLKGIDFGCSQMMSEDARLKKRTGTPLYMAPEIFFGWYGLEVDVWAAGMLLYQMVCGKLPFFGDDSHEFRKGPTFMVVQAVMDSELEFEGEIWDKMPNSLKDLISKMLDIDYNERISAEDCLQHPWLLEHEKLMKCSSSNILKFPRSPGTAVGNGRKDTGGNGCSA